MKHYKSVEFCQFLQCQTPLHKWKPLCWRLSGDGSGLSAAIPLTVRIEHVWQRSIIIRGNSSFIQTRQLYYLLTMRFLSLFTILVRKEYLAKTNNLPKRYGVGSLRRGAQCSRVGCIGLRPALSVRAVHLLFGFTSWRNWFFTGLTPNNTTLWRAQLLPYLCPVFRYLLVTPPWSALCVEVNYIAVCCRASFRIIGCCFWCCCCWRCCCFSMSFVCVFAFFFGSLRQRSPNVFVRGPHKLMQNMSRARHLT